MACSVSGHHLHSAAMKTAQDVQDTYEPLQLALFLMLLLHPSMGMMAVASLLLTVTTVFRRLYAEEQSSNCSLAQQTQYGLLGLCFASTSALNLESID